MVLALGVAGQVQIPASAAASFAGPVQAPASGGLYSSAPAAALPLQTEGHPDIQYGEPKVLHVLGDDTPNDTCTEWPTVQDLCRAWSFERRDLDLDGSMELTVWLGEFGALDDARAVLTSGGAFIAEDYRGTSPNESGCDANKVHCFYIRDSEDSQGSLYSAVYHYVNPGCPPGTTCTRDSSGDDLLWGGPGNIASALAVDGAGNAFFYAGTEDRVYKVTRTGDLTHVAGTPNGTRALGGDPKGFEFWSGVNGLIFDKVGNLLITETGQGNVRMITGIGDMAAPVPDEQTYGSCGLAEFAVNPSQCLSDPVNTAMGAFTHSETDLRMPGVGIPFDFTRSYTSSDAGVGRLGKGWSFNFDVTISEALVNGYYEVTVTGGTGQVSSFKRSRYAGATDPWIGSPGVRATLTKTSTGWTLVKPDQSEYTFTTAGSLTSIKDRNGNGLTLSYSGGLLNSVTDDSGRTSTLVKAAVGDKIEEVRLPDGRSVKFAYTGDLLTQVTDPRGHHSVYGYDSDGRLDSIRDPRGNFKIRNTYSPQGRVVEQLDPMGNRSTFAWDIENQAVTMTDARGATWTDNYSGNALVSRVDPLGNTTNYHYDQDLNLIGTRDPRGNFTLHEYDARGNRTRTSVPAPLNYEETFKYNNRNDLTESVDRRGRKTVYAYDAAGNLTSVTAPDDSSITYGRATDGTALVTSITDARDKVTLLGHDADGNPTSTTLPDGARTTRTFDSTGRQLTRVDPRGNAAGAVPGDYTTTYNYSPTDQVLTVTDALDHSTVNTYDEAGNLTTVTDPLGRVTTFTYSAANELLTRDEPRGVTTLTYDVRGQLASQTQPDGAKTTFTYDAARRLQKMVAPRGNVAGADPAAYATTYEYNATGQRTKVTDPLGRATTSTYDELGRLSTTTDALNRTTTFAYDGGDNLVSSTNALGHQTEYTYNDAHQVLTLTDPLDHATTFAYDENGNLTRTTDAVGNAEVRTYDAASRLATIVDARGQVAGADAERFTTHLAYDLAGNLRTVTDPLGHVTSREYDAANHLTALVDPRGKRTAYTHDAASRLKEVTDPLGAITQYGYDSGDNVNELTNANGKVSTSTYDPVGRQLSQTDALGRTRTATYDANGNLTSATDAVAHAAGNPALGTQTYTWDRADQLTQIAYSDSTVGVAFEYDAVGNRTKMTEAAPGAGNCAVVTLCQNVQVYTYDKVDQLTNVARASNTFKYVYDAAGRVTSRTYPGGAATTYGHDAADRLKTVTVGTATTNYTWDPASHLTLTALPNGVNETRSYDDAGQVVSIEAKLGSNALTSFAYQRDPAGNPTQIVTPAEQQHLGYDARGQLTDVCYGASPCTTPTLSYTYDPVGNRLTKTAGGVPTTYDYDDADQLTSATTGGTSTTYAYNANGNVTRAGQRTFAWDAAGRMTSSVLGAATSTYTYDGDGLQSKATTKSGLTTTNITLRWDTTLPTPQLATEQIGGTTSRYVYGTDRINVVTGSKTSYFLKDQLGSTTALIAANGTVERALTYKPFGELASETPAAPTSPNTRLRYTGEYNDAQTGNYYLRARTYDPGAARFDRPDPLPPVFGQTALNTYAYANNQPTVLTDPSGGRASEPGLGCAGGLVAGYYDALMFGLPSRLINRVAEPFGGALDPTCTTLGQYGGMLGAALLPIGRFPRPVTPTAGFVTRAEVRWIDETATMSDAAAGYQAGAFGSRSTIATRLGQAPELSGVRFDGFDEAAGVLIDRKLSVTTFPKSMKQALRQSYALTEGGYAGRWEVPTAAQAARARRMFDQLGISNISVLVVPK